MNKTTNFKYTIEPNFDYVLEESNNTFISLRKIGWGDKEPKLDIRKWYSSADGNETMGKGISISDQGANELVRVLTETGYGDTNEILGAIKNRENFRSELNKILNKDDEHYDKSLEGKEDIYYDPRLALFGEDESA